MRTIQELAARANVTDTATSQISETQAQIWSKKVLQYGQALRRFDQAVEMNEELLGVGAKTLTLIKETGTLDITTTKSEADERTRTELTNLDTVDITFSNSDWYEGAVEVSKQIVMTSQVDLISQARYSIAQAMADDFDLDVAQTVYEDTGISNVVYGGSGNAGVDDLADGDVITTDLVADAQADLESNNFVPKMLFIGSEQIKQFRKDSQFVNASEYGSDDVLLKGEIGKTYLGVKVIVTTNTTSYSSGATDTNESPTTWGADGTVCPLVGVNRQGRMPGVMAWKEKPHIDYEYDKDRSAHNVYYDQAFKSALLQADQVSLIKVTDA